MNLWTIILRNLSKLSLRFGGRVFEGKEEIYCQISEKKYFFYLKINAGGISGEVSEKKIHGVISEETCRILVEFWKIV